MEDQKRLYRSTEDRMFAGVCGGIAEYLEVDSTLVRLVFVALALMGGPSLIVYIIMMLIVPERPTDKRKSKRGMYEDYPAPQAEQPASPAGWDDRSTNDEPPPPIA